MIRREQIQASYHDGVLRLTIPVAEKAKPELVNIGINVAGIGQILDLEARNARLESDNTRLASGNSRLRGDNTRLKSDYALGSRRR